MDDDTPPHATTRPTGAVAVRPMRPGDAPAVRRIFRETLALGSPTTLPAAELARYERLCLGWHQFVLISIDHDHWGVAAGFTRGPQRFRFGSVEFKMLVLNNLRNRKPVR